MTPVLLIALITSTFDKKHSINEIICFSRAEQRKTSNFVEMSSRLRFLFLVASLKVVESGFCGVNGSLIK